MTVLKKLVGKPDLSLYECEAVSSQGTRAFVVSTPETRAITNDPFVTGFRYTQTLAAACARSLSALEEAGRWEGKESPTKVLHILRGGLNFGLRDALATAFRWNQHGSLFVSAQRARSVQDPRAWHITEKDYQKLDLGQRNEIVFGDVVATGTSLEYALSELARCALKQHSSIERVTFFTIGGIRALDILNALHTDETWQRVGLISSQVVFFEGIFAVANDASPLRIKIDGTDLLRRDSVLAPEFIESQYSDASYPLERCTIYDAGSRAFDQSEYMGDVRDYWEQVRQLAEAGASFEQLLAERMPELTIARFPGVDLSKLCDRQIERAEKSLQRLAA